MAQVMKIILNRVENIVEKGESTDYQHFLLISSFLSLLHQSEKSYKQLRLVRL